MQAPSIHLRRFALPPLGFFDGVGALLRGIAFVVGTPSIWPYAAVPVVVALVLVVGFGALGIWGAGALSAAIVGNHAEIVRPVLTFLFGVVAVLVALLLAMSLAQPLSGFALDRIVRAQERALGADVTADEPLATSVLRSLRVTLAALAIGLPAIATLTLIGVLFPPAAVVTLPLKLVVAALLLAWDLLDYPLSPRGLGVRARVAWMRQQRRAVLGFGLAATALMLIPGVGLLVLPMAVAGATRMAVARRPG